MKALTDRLEFIKSFLIASKADPGLMDIFIELNAVAEALPEINANLIGHYVIGNDGERKLDGAVVVSLQPAIDIEELTGKLNDMQRRICAGITGKNPKAEERQAHKDFLAYLRARGVNGTFPE